MGEEEAALGVVGIGVSLAVFVVNSVVAAPLVDGVLEGHGLETGEEDAKGHLGPVAAVRPETVGAGRDADAAKGVEDVGANDRLPLGRDEALAESDEGADVERRHEDYIAPDDGRREVAGLPVLFGLGLVRLGIESSDGGYLLLLVLLVLLLQGLLEAL